MVRIVRIRKKEDYNDWGLSQEGNALSRCIYTEIRRLRAGRQAGHGAMMLHKTLQQRSHLTSVDEGRLRRVRLASVGPRERAHARVQKSGTWFLTPDRRRFALSRQPRLSHRTSLRQTACCPGFNLSAPASSLQIGVVIATKNRSGMLVERALAAVKRQTRVPDYLLVVDDSLPEFRPRNRSIVASVELPGCHVTYLENGRTAGASGSWNTAVTFLLGAGLDPECLFVAILDDDDAWANSYLDRCESMARDQSLDMVAADMRRYEDLDAPPSIEEAPARLCAEDFLTRNPGIQGSNLFLRLSVLLAAGGFDEALQSTTDRDLCIRIADLGDVRYARLPLALVDHYADSGRERLSSRGSAAKLDGLTNFWRKYSGRMTFAQCEAFSGRATSLFDWRQPLSPDHEIPAIESGPPTPPIVIGLTAHNDQPSELLNVVRKLVACKGEDLVGPDVVLLEHGRCFGAPPLLIVAAEILRDAGARCFCVTAQQQLDDIKAGFCHPHPKSVTESVLDLSWLQDTLCRYCIEVAQVRADSVVWVADSRTDADSAPKGQSGADFLKWIGAKHVSGESSMIHPVDALDPERESVERWREQERVATAKHRIRRRFSLGGADLRLLGCGSEAVVLTDGRMVYKCIDQVRARTPRDELIFLRSQVGRWENVSGLYPLRDVEVNGRWAVITYHYEESTPYLGGYEEELIHLLRGCRGAGIVCNNVHPKNLVIAPSGVKLIDYGADIRPWSPVGFEHMARRAFLASKHPELQNLQSLMRRVLTDVRIPEMEGYDRFRRRVDGQNFEVSAHAGAGGRNWIEAPSHELLSLYIGVITSDPRMLRPLLHSLVLFRSSRSLKNLAILILDNGSPTAEFQKVVHEARSGGLRVAVVSEPQQSDDAATGSFGAPFRRRPGGQVGIAQARTMLQRYLGTILSSDQGSYGWILDDDMRVDDRAHEYLRWLPAFRDRGADVLLGHYEGSSPNPPLNGIRVHLVDLFHNLLWLRNLPTDAKLPDRTAENAAQRLRFPDYYYDLSRKHSAHLEMPHWLEPSFQGETVGEAHSRLLAGALGILNGNPLTRPIAVSVASDPLESARDSVNRGGCTFILNHRSLLLTPNLIPIVGGCEARRSDMMWAIVNRYYRRMSIKAVAFPIQHVGRIHGPPCWNLDKVLGEIIGSALYAGLTEFLRDRPHHELDFSVEEADEIRALAENARSERLVALEQSFYRIAGLRESLRRIAQCGEIDDLLGFLDQWFTHRSFAQIRSGASALSREDVVRFLLSLRSVSDEFASATADVGFIQDQFAASLAGTNNEC